MAKRPLKHLHLRGCQASYNPAVLGEFSCLLERPVIIKEIHYANMVSHTPEHLARSLNDLPILILEQIPCLKGLNCIY